MEEPVVEITRLDFGQNHPARIGENHPALTLIVLEFVNSNISCTYYKRTSSFSHWVTIFINENGVVDNTLKMYYFRSSPSYAVEGYVTIDPAMEDITSSKIYNFTFTPNSTKMSSSLQNSVKELASSDFRLMIYALISDGLGNISIGDIGFITSDFTKYDSIHTWDSGSVTKEPTFDEEGSIIYSCVICGKTKTEPVEKLEPPTPDPAPTPTPAPQTKLTVTKLSKVTVKKNVATVVWKKNNTGKGYEIQYTTDKKFKKFVKIVKIKKNKTTQTTIKKLKKGTWYVRIRTVNGKKTSACPTGLL